MNLDTLERHFANVDQATDSAAACFALEPVFSAYRVMSFEPSVITCWRARKTEGRPWAKFEEMSYPPSEKASVQRLSDAGKPCLYAATGIETALIEIDVQPGELVQLVCFRHRHDHALRLALVGDYHHLAKRGYLRIANDLAANKAMSNAMNAMTRTDYQSLLFSDAFLDSVIATERGDDPDYVRSRAAAAMIYRQPGLDGLAYRSVPDRLGMNFAIKPDAVDSKLRVVSAILVRVLGIRRFGFIEFAIIQDAENLKDDGTFNWKPAQHPNHARHFNLTAEEATTGIDLADDRVH